IELVGIAAGVRNSDDPGAVTIDVDARAGRPAPFQVYESCLLGCSSRDREDYLRSRRRARSGEKNGYGPAALIHRNQIGYRVTVQVSSSHVNRIPADAEGRWAGEVVVAAIYENRKRSRAPACDCNVRKTVRVKIRYGDAAWRIAAEDFRVSEKASVAVAKQDKDL